MKEENKKVKKEEKVKKVKEKQPKEKKTKENKELELIKEENSKLNEKILRISAEIQNIRRRNDEEKEKLCKYEGEALIKKLLPIVDNFERAINLDDSNLTDELSKFLEGFKMIYGNIIDILKGMEVTEIECLNKEFDPNFMEAVLTSHEEGIKENTVIDVLQKGYMYKDKVVRVAMVKVNN